jgi:hypothetical protein
LFDGESLHLDQLQPVGLVGVADQCPSAGRHQDAVVATGTAHRGQYPPRVVRTSNPPATIAPVDGPIVPVRGVSFPHLPALDGIRAVAMLAVFAYHGNQAWARGGSLGVVPARREHAEKGAVGFGGHADLLRHYNDLLREHAAADPEHVSIVDVAAMARQVPVSPGRSP